MLTSVAIASSAVGGTPTMCSPHGSRRDSISISLRYTLPITRSRASMDRLAASSAAGSATSLSRLHWRAVSMMVAVICSARPDSRIDWYEEMSSLSSLRPLYRPAFSAGGVR
jgi:hypothetical protein